MCIRDREHPVATHFEHRHQRMLHQRAAGRSFQVRQLLLIERVRGMIRRYDVYASVRDSAAQRIAVGLAFDSRIPLDKIPHAGVVGVTEPQVMHAHLVRNPFTGEPVSYTHLDVYKRQQKYPRDAEIRIFVRLQSFSVPSPYFFRADSTSSIRPYFCASGAVIQ